MARTVRLSVAAAASALAATCFCASSYAAAEVVVKVVDENNMPIADARVTANLDQKKLVWPEMPRAGEYVFQIGQGVTCFVLSVWTDGNPPMEPQRPLYGLSAKVDQSITVVLFRKRQKLSQMGAGDAIRYLGALEDRANFPLVVGEENAPAGSFTELKGEAVDSELKGAIEKPNDDWGDASKTITDKARKVRADLEKLPSKDEPLDKK